MSASLNNGDTVNAVHDTLACAYRRRILGQLVSSEDGVSVTELAEHLLDHDDVTGDHNRVAARLHHVTLPKLAARGFVEYDERSHTVQYRESPVIERQLRLTTTAES